MANTHATVEIPGNSTLRPFARSGAEGRCVLCRKLVTAHVGKKGQWVGCSGAAATEALSKAPFMLIPVAEPGIETAFSALALILKGLVDPNAKIPVVTHTAPNHGVKHLLGNGKVGKDATLHRRLRVGAYVYEAKDGRRKLPEDVSQGRQDAYSALKTSAKPLTVREVAEKADHPKETTQQFLAWLVKHKFAVRASVQ